MTFILFPAGRRFFLNRAMQPGLAESDDLRVGTYKNNYTPAVGDDGSAIVESTFPGYASVVIPYGDFADAIMSGNDAVSASGVTPVYTCTGGAGELVYGMFLLETADGNMLGAGRFDTPLNMVSGAVITLDPFTAQLPLV